MGQPAVALALVRCATALLPPPHRARYFEQRQADVQGAAELGLSPLRLAAGTAVAAVRITVVTRKETSAMQPVGPLALALRLVGGTGTRRRAATLAALFTLTLLAGVGLLLTR
ncbi:MULTISPECIES: hypothetical protein [Micromonospora]|uniref:Uncharacterized protein n=1 Tax=Micromonospora solifontis TaxID=2487138 RepID=A0ABX9WE24_9ACTN|nr:MULTISPECIES: hypothetical protein [Micromonospora]NES16597.1 hypothetical protein [Micromonospora sp. PPF5-17B]NES38373.1 hypothetical protein [Micromonospora solifontis]NES58376.1 hypothetical protein [Micromonospora sp. PPF5-6]RNL95845.1 hypothetical protein EFE23_19800 [Micromonospora solifontis]